MKVKNVTNSVQGIEFIDGGCVRVLSGCECDIDENKIYDFELKRILKVFEEIKKKVEPKVENKKEKVKDDFFNGGIE